MKTIKNLFSLFLVILFLVGCTEEEKESFSIVGTWKSTTVDFSACSGADRAEETFTRWTITFNEDNTFTWVTTNPSSSTTGTYELKPNNFIDVTFVNSSGVNKYIYSLSSNILTLALNGQSSCIEEYTLERQ